ncbi:dienelactone hydrolase family protein [Hyphococcus lacteus]|uniref:Prolyl oligopeptidase family serine peptidase n=1 Tax=Hyphococcus lacteus TaxID=3143536 RepID=A0ABV3Z1S3_9PROT
MKRWQIGLLLITILAGVLIWKREPLAFAWFTSKLEKTTLAERINLLDDAIEIRLPDGIGPFPVVLQFHGCAGIRPEFQHQWADIANNNGYAAVIIDSNSPRGYSREESIAVICAGQDLLGFERAGDVFAALEFVEQDQRLDEDRIILAGWSHGAWTIMDFLTMDTRKAPPGISDSEVSVPDIDGAILFYPYCGFGTLTRFKPLSQSPKMLSFVAGSDEVVNAQECLTYFEKRKRRDPSLEFITYTDANHVFDDPFLEPDYIHWYNEEYFKDAVSRYENFLQSAN